MTDQEMHAGIIALLKAGLTHPQSEFKPISNYMSYQNIKKYIRNTRRLLKGISNMIKQLDNTYLAKLRSEDSVDLSLIVGCSQLRTCYEFFNTELQTAIDMKVEYSDYLFSGHLKEQLLGYDREFPEE